MKKKTNFIRLSGIIIASIAVVAALAFFIYSFINLDGNIKNLATSFIIFLIALVGLISLFIKKDIDRTIVNISTLLLVILLIVFSFVTFDNNIVGNKNIVLDFNNKTVAEVLKWASENGIDVEQKYEYSDNVPEFGIISQNYAYGTDLDTIDTLIIVVSLGPNYDKQVIIPSYVGTNIDEALASLKEYYLNNIRVVFQKSDNIEKDIIIDQSIKGQMKRNDLLILTVALDSAITEINMVDLINDSLFDATLWLNRNQVKYELKYEFSDTILRNKVMNQSIAKDTLVNIANDKVILTISKGKAIIVPDLTNMTIEQITKWIVDNKLKILYSDQYDQELELGKIINANYKSGDEIEEGTTIELVMSKGVLKMREFTSINEFRTWAQEYDINTNEVYEFNKAPKGSIIKYSIAKDTVINPDDTITIYISNGSPISIPNFVGKTKTSITSTCNSIGLKCSFTYAGYSTLEKDIAISQNKNAGSEVITGTSITIGLSSGIAKTSTVYITESQLAIGNANETIKALKTYFANEYPGVTFVFVGKVSTVYNNDGFIHESSPIKDGSKVTQGKTYSIWITES